MPIYAYRCASCGHAKDVLQKLSDPPLTQCPSCGAQAFSKQVTAAGFQLKGSGWYATDFKGDKSAKESDSGEGGKTDAGKTDAGKPEPSKSDTVKAETSKPDSPKPGESGASSKSGDSGTSSSSGSGVSSSTKAADSGGSRAGH